MDNALADARRRERAAEVRGWSTEEFYGRLVEAGIRRAYFVHENGELTVSHASPLLAAIRAFFELSHDFSGHEAAFIGRDDGTKTPFFAFVHDTRRGLSQGGLRIREYGNMAELLTDGLRLSKGMTQKNALAGLNWGGGKGIIAMPSGYGTPQEFRDEPRYRDARTELFREYGRFVASLKGVYYTAEDMNTNTDDMAVLLGVNRFTTCLKAERGGSGNPSPFTARGVFAAMRAAWKFLRKTEDLRGVRVAVQGVGNVGQPLVELLYRAGARVVIADPDKVAVDATVEFLGARAAHCASASAVYENASANIWILDNLEAIFDIEADVFSPCSIGGQLNGETIPRLRVSLVCGAANNQLRDGETDASRLVSHGITYVPDFLCNRMGIMNCADEWYGYLREDVLLAAERVFPDTLRVLRYAHDLRITTQEAAESLANVAASELHPVLGHRGRRIIDSILRSSWLSTTPHQEERAAKPKMVELGFAPAIDEPRLQREAEQRGFTGDGPAIAATPISAAARPHLGAFLAPLLMDIEVRRRRGEAPRRVIGVDHGGLALQQSIEISLPYGRTDTSRSDFVRECRDRFDVNDAAIRKQLHETGIGFDAHQWLDPIAPEGEAVVRAAYFRLRDSGRLWRKEHNGWRCPHCETVLVASDTEPTRVSDTVFVVRLRAGNTTLESRLPLLEDLVGATAVAVRGEGPYAALDGSSVENPVTGRVMPIIVWADSVADAALLVPFGRTSDQEILATRGLHDVATIYDAEGRVPIGAYTYDREEARRRIAGVLGGAVDTEEIKDKEVRRCVRCRTIVDADSSIQQIVDFSREARVLRQLIESGGVAFNNERWRTVALTHLEELGRWCISRQSWWGNEIPDGGGEVFSPWFSLAAWSLQAAGWPRTVEPEPIEVVYTDPEFLTRWILPSQCLALAVHGRPVYRDIRIHGSVHVVERAEDDKRRVPEVPDNAPDEARFLYRTVRRPMRTQYGNVVEPGTLVARFGADALRLWYVLSLRGGATDIVTMAEGHGRAARRALEQLNSGLSQMLDNGGDLVDAGVAAEIARVAGKAEHAWSANDLAAVGDALLEAAKVISRHARTGSATAATATVVIAQMYTTFHPICPFLLTKFRDVTQRDRSGR